MEKTIRSIIDEHCQDVTEFCNQILKHTAQPETLKAIEEKTISFIKQTLWKRMQKLQSHIWNKKSYFRQVDVKQAIEAL